LRRRAIQDDGKIVVVGSAKRTMFLDFAIVRYTTDGKIDRSFGKNGIVLHGFDMNFERYKNDTKASMLSPWLMMIARAFAGGGGPDSK